MSIKKSRTILEESADSSTEISTCSENRVQHVVTSVQNLKDILHESQSQKMHWI